MLPEIRDPEIFRAADEILKQLYGGDATFRPGQYEAIEAVMTRSRTLVVQRTGWGKSLVYFICTRLLRLQGRGVTMVISPLLVLMENQIAAAQAMGLRCDVLNSTVKDRREAILAALEGDELDLLLVTPETLFAEDVQQRLRNIRIGLFVIDEAHCISDWGHDFRLEYSNLRKVIGLLPAAVPILATTATANDRVIADLQAQLGQEVYLSRGPLTRDSLYIQILPLSDQIRRYAWILENVPRLPGSGIVYCLTQRDCDYLAAFLVKHGICAAAYYSRGTAEGEELNHDIERRFRENRLKVIVATVKLGMGYDKGDIAFIIHYQMPANIVSYYQQIGRAGRSIPRAYIFLMHGKEDDDILNYFINTAFPTRDETDRIVQFIGSGEGVRESQILAALNIRLGRVRKALSFLMNDGFVRKERSLYYLTPKRYFYDGERYSAISAIRRREMEQMHALTQTRQCYSRFIVNSLDDPAAGDCGHCANCLGRELVPSTVGEDSIRAAAAFLEKLTLPIEPRKMWPAGPDTKGGRIRLQNLPGIALARYGDPGYGALVRRDKYSASRRFCDELVGKSARLLQSPVREHGITAVCCVPSLRSDGVRDFAQRLAERLGLPFADLLEKTEAAQQKEMENSAFQCANARRSFRVRPGLPVPENILLVDDIVDSRWTLTVCGFRLMEAGARKVYPFALADSSSQEEPK